MGIENYRRMLVGGLVGVALGGLALTSTAIVSSHIQDYLLKTEIRAVNSKSFEDVIDDMLEESSLELGKANFVFWNSSGGAYIDDLVVKVHKNSARHAFLPQIEKATWIKYNGYILGVNYTSDSNCVSWILKIEPKGKDFADYVRPSPVGFTYLNHLRGQKL